MLYMIPITNKTTGSLRMEGLSTLFLLLLQILEDFVHVLLACAGYWLQAVGTT